MSQQLPDHLSTGDGIFTLEEIQCLEEDAIFLPPPSPLGSSGKRQVSATFSPPSSLTIASSSTSSSSSASVRTWNFDSGTKYNFAIPTEEESAAVLVYIGFTEPTATMLFDRYANRPDPGQNPDILMDYVYGHICNISYEPYNGMEHKEAMAQIGLNQQIQEAIADPYFSDIFWTRDLHYWVKDTLDANYATLLARQELLKSHAGQRIANKRKKRSSIHGVFQQEGGELSGSQQPNVTATVNMTSKYLKLPAAHVAVQGEGPILPNHVVLYKGKGLRDFPRLGGSLIMEDGSIDMTSLRTAPGGDFNWQLAAHYWTPEKSTAEKYRDWAAHRSPESETCLIRIQVPVEFVGSLYAVELWHSTDWKEYVWWCRNEREPNPKFEYLEEPDVIKGHICRAHSEPILNMRLEDVNTRLTDDNVLLCPSTGRKAIQWVFMKRQTVKQLAVEVRGKMHIDIFAAMDSSGGSKK